MQVPPQYVWRQCEYNIFIVYLMTQTIISSASQVHSCCAEGSSAQASTAAAKRSNPRLELFDCP
jgi:hypothetical protein